jgi:hypothetical protein
MQAAGLMLPNVLLLGFVHLLHISHDTRCNKNRTHTYGNSALAVMVGQWHPTPC